VTLLRQIGVATSQGKRRLMTLIDEFTRERLGRDHRRVKNLRRTPKKIHKHGSTIFS
jgi:hypothetical protein